MPVKTEVHEFDKVLVQHFIERELRRGGQVYLVHNRVETIGRLEHLVRELVPAARAAVVHGQMNKRLLEESMMRFVQGEVDVLIATTIIESGLDIPNANTLIVDSAHMIGLADLHQLRGRVGRGRHRAHALFLLPGRRTVSEIAEKRLRTIEEHSGLGAGFRIALKDLEIRGAGNILGSEQSGYIADVGYELYCRLLENAVRELRKEKVTDATDTYVDLDVGARFAEGYGGDTALRLGFYRRIAGARDRAELDALQDEIADRCGPMPDEARLLFDVGRLRILGQDHGIGRFSLETGRRAADRVLRRGAGVAVPEKAPGPFASPSDGRAGGGRGAGRSAHAPRRAEGVSRKVGLTDRPGRLSPCESCFRSCFSRARFPPRRTAAVPRRGATTTIATDSRSRSTPRCSR